ncbi:AMP-binding protein [Streptomyces lunalinharesii]|uniref:AMP-binding protein n=1 Tax=Streptomyces lunalinharesii TaxID=333384 RepID=A0ABN3SZH0_9ACTN
MPTVGPPFRSHVEKHLDVLRGHPERVVLVHGKRHVTAGRFHALVHKMAWALHGRGIARGQTVTLLSGNSPELFAARYAAHLLGCRVTHLYGELSASAQAAIVRDVETAALVVDPRLAARAVEVVALVPVDEFLVLGDAKDGRDLLELAEGQSDEPFASRARPEDVCTIRYTSGTTGHSKGICTTFKQAHDDFDQHQLWQLMGKAGALRQLVCTTLAQSAAVLADGTLRAGGTVVLLDRFDAGEVLAAIEREHITHFYLLPPLLCQLLDHPDAARADLSSLRLLIYSGGRSSPARVADALHRFGPVLMQVYGQGEAGAISMLSPADHTSERRDLMRTAGKVLPGVEVEVRDAQGEPVPVGEPGEICVRSPEVMQGYWKQPELTAQVLRDGWVRTGDVGRLAADGYLTITDRVKDVIALMDGDVYTTELEDLFDSHPQVLESAVFGVRDEDQTERVHAVVVLVPGATIGAQGLREMVRREKGVMYEPARIFFAASLVLTETGKPDKREMRRRFGHVAAG